MISKNQGNTFQGQDLWRSKGVNSLICNVISKSKKEPDTWKDKKAGENVMSENPNVGNSWPCLREVSGAGQQWTKERMRKKKWEWWERLRSGFQRPPKSLDIKEYDDRQIWRATSLLADRERGIFSFRIVRVSIKTANKKCL